jgi:hypothetical protein
VGEWLGMQPTWNHQPWRDVALFESFEAGRVFEAFLRDKGFVARTDDDKWFRYFLFLRPPRVVYHVQVRTGRFVDAVKLLEAQAPAVLGKALHCPACSSLRLNYPQMTRRFILPTVLLHLGIIFRVIEHECYCEHCHNMWNLPADLEAHHKPRMAK